MEYNVVVTLDAEEDLNRFVGYLLNEKKNEQAAISVLDDYDKTIDKLKRVAGSLKLCENPKLNEFGYHRINFMKHRYFMLYRIEGITVYIDNIFHELQDYENRMI